MHVAGALLVIMFGYHTGPRGNKQGIALLQGLLGQSVGRCQIGRQLPRWGKSFLAVNCFGLERCIMRSAVFLV
jgi:hypothetical protein